MTPRRHPIERDTISDCECTEKLRSDCIKSPRLQPLTSRASSRKSLRNVNKKYELSKREQTPSPHAFLLCEIPLQQSHLPSAPLQARETLIPPLSPTSPPLKLRLPQRHSISEIPKRTELLQWRMQRVPNPKSWFFFIVVVPKLIMYCVILSQ